MNIIVDDLLVNFTRQGKGKQLLMLHGWGDQLTSFDTLAREFEKTHEVIRLDLAGFGKSQAPKEPWNLDDYARYVSHFIVKLSLSPYAIIGHSNGGAIAIQGIGTGQIKANKLILIASAGVRPKATGHKLAWKAIARTGKTITRLLPASSRDSLRSKLYKAAGSDMLVAPGMEQTFKLIVNQDVRTVAEKITIPTLIINGDQDQATPLSYARILNAAIKKSQLFEVHGAGHFVHHENPDIVVTQIKDFL